MESLYFLKLFMGMIQVKIRKILLNFKVENQLASSSLTFFHFSTKFFEFNFKSLVQNLMTTGELGQGVLINDKTRTCILAAVFDVALCAECI